MLGPSEFIKIFSEIDERSRHPQLMPSEGMGCFGKGVAVCAATAVLGAVYFDFPRKDSSAPKQADAAPTSPLPPKAADSPR